MRVLKQIRKLVSADLGGSQISSNLFKATNLVTDKAPVLLWPPGLTRFQVLSLCLLLWISPSVSVSLPLCLFSFCRHLDLIAENMATKVQIQISSAHPTPKGSLSLLAFQYQSHRRPLIGCLGHVMGLPFNRFLMANSLPKLMPTFPNCRTLSGKSSPDKNYISQPHLQPVEATQLVLFRGMWTKLIMCNSQATEVMKQTHLSHW